MTTEYEPIYTVNIQICHVRINLEKLGDLLNHALILMDDYAAIFSNRYVDMAVK